MLWQLTIKGCGYDSYDSHIVRAPTEDEARAAVPCGGECPRHTYTKHGSCVWQNPKKTTCNHLPVEGNPGVILSSFNAG